LKSLLLALGSLLLLPTPVFAQEIISLSPEAFSLEFSKLALELNEGGMSVPSIDCNPDRTECGGVYGSSTRVVARATSPTDGIVVVSVVRTLEGESADFWLAIEMVADIIDPAFPSSAERAATIMGAIRSAPAKFDGVAAAYVIETVDGQLTMTATAKP
jgi:hypothetical protein